MKKIYSLVMAILTTVIIAKSQNTWIGQATGGSWASSTNWSAGTVPTAADDVVIGDGVSGTINNVANVTVRTLTINGNSNVTLDYSGVGVARKLTISNSNGNAEVDLTVEAGSELTIAGTNFTGIELATNADATIAGTLAVGIGRSFLTGGGNSVTTITGTLNNFGTISTSSGSLIFGNNGTYIHSQNGGVIPGANWDGNSNCVIAGVLSTMPTGFDQEFGNFEWNSPDQNTGLSFGGDLGDIQGDLKITNTGTGAIYLSNNEEAEYSTTVFGNYIQTGGTFVITQTSGEGTLEVQGNFNMSGGTLTRNSPLAPANSSTIDFDGNKEHTFTKTGGAISGAIDFEVSAGSTIDFGTSILNGSTGKFTLPEGAKIITSHPQGLNSAGAFGPIQTATREFGEEAEYEFRGAATGIFNTGASTDATPSIVRGLIINNTAGSVTLSKPVTIANNGPGIQKLYLQNGVLITTAANILKLNDEVQATGVDAGNANQYNRNSFVDGPMTKIGDDDFIFPVGKVGSGLHRVGIDLPASPGDLTAFTAQYFRSDPTTLSETLAPTLTRVSSCEYWTVERTGAPGDPFPNQARVILSWESNSSCGGAYVTEPATLAVAHLVDGTWVNEGQVPASRTEDPDGKGGTITSNNLITTFSPFALATTSAIGNPLPVVFGDVKAYEMNNGVKIDWSNLTEKDVTEYAIERSSNGKDFDVIAIQWPTGNQEGRADYSAFDASPIQSTNYYRIKTTEASGKIVYSKILSVNINRNALGLTLYPNPVKDNQVTISLLNMKRGSYHLRVVNATGQDIFRKTILNQSSSFTQTLSLPSSVKPGVYNMIITADGYRETKMFIVQ